METTKTYRYLFYMFLLVVVVMIITGSVLVSQNPSTSNEFNIGIILIVLAIVGPIILFIVAETTLDVFYPISKY